GPRQDGTGRSSRLLAFFPRNHRLVPKSSLGVAHKKLDYADNRTRTPIKFESGAAPATSCGICTAAGTRPFWRPRDHLGTFRRAAKCENRMTIFDLRRAYHD